MTITIEAASDAPAWMDYSVQMAKVLAWPIVVLVVLYLFRKKLPSLAENIESLEGLGGAIRWRRKVNVVKDETERLKDEEGLDAVPASDLGEAGTAGPPVEEGKPVDDYDLLIASGGQTFAILTMWLQLQGSLHDLAKRHGLLPNMELRTNPNRLMEKLLMIGAVSPTQATLVSALWSLHNEVTQGLTRPISKADAEGFRDSVRTLQAAWRL